MQFKTIMLLSLVIAGCHHGNSQQQDTIAISLPVSVDSIPLPTGYQRIKVSPNSYSAWLRNVRLKNDNRVFLYNGILKPNQEAQYAVLDISVGDKDLQQCADAAMRLRAEFLYMQQLYSDIVFYDNAGKPYIFEKPYDREHFDRYLQKVFGMCGSASLSKQLNAKSDFTAIMPGDVLVKGGFPGHVATVMDVAEDVDGNRIYLLSQSYMPAQDIHILVNPLDPEHGPWFPIPATDTLYTPEWRFHQQALHRW